MELPGRTRRRRRQAGRRSRDARGQPADLGAARGRPGFVPERRDRARRPGDEMLAVLDPRVEEDLTAYFGPDGSAPDGRVGGAMADRDVDFLLVGGGLAAAYCAVGAAQAGRRGLDPARRPRARAAVRAPAAVEGVPARRGAARGRLRQPGRLVRGERRRAADADERDVARPEARTAKLQGGEEVGFGKALIATGAIGEHPPRRGRRARGDPLPARLRQLRRDPRGGRGGRARGPDRRQLHRRRGGRLADARWARAARS